MAILELTLLLCSSFMCWRFLHGNICEFSSENTLGARGILALLVVVSHWNLKYGEGTLLYNLFPSGTIAVAVFFFMGGYGLMKSFDAKGYTYIKSFFRKRFVKIIPPWLFCSMIWISCVLLWDQTYFEYLVKRSVLNRLTVVPNTWFCYILVLNYFWFWVCAKCWGGIGRKCCCIILLVAFF